MHIQLAYLVRGSIRRVDSGKMDARITYGRHISGDVDENP